VTGLSSAAPLPAPSACRLTGNAGAKTFRVLLDALSNPGRSAVLPTGYHPRASLRRSRSRSRWRTWRSP